MPVITIEKTADFQSEVLDYKDGVVIIDWQATWCGPCQQIAPHIEALSNDPDIFKHNVKFCKVDVDVCADLAEAFQITNLPTFMFVALGKVINSFSGANINLLRQNIEVHKTFISASLSQPSETAPSSETWASF